ncbi:hypothetical protein C5B94_14550, partial [Clavibacter michiganensis]|uniref:hypothetical protein n=1 Tax=Clavibacter michiganensis TaxID=28447 RepID=UPI000D4C9756
MRRLAAGALAAALALGGLAAGAAASATETAGAMARGTAAATAAVQATAGGSATGLSDTGRGAIDDLRTCLASSDVLNVYYLVDNSGSLSSGGATGRGSDPDVARADILGGSLAELGALGDDLTVNWGAAFFSSAFQPAVGWTAYDDGSPDRLRQTIRDKRPTGDTDWLAALQGVQAQLQDQPSAGSACQLVLWMTDGRIDLGNASATADAVNALCGRPISSGAAPQGYGLLAALRQSGVVVIGTLLADGAARDQAAVMYPLVEGSGPYQGSTVACGPPEAPEGAVRGAVVDASDPDALAAVFLQLGSRIAGGYPQPLAADGSFWIDAGVSRVQIVVADDGWSLEAPAGSGLGTVTEADLPAGVSVRQSSGARLVEVDAADPALAGQWRLTADGVEDVYFFSDLRIVFDDANEVTRSADGSLEATLSARVERADGRPADLRAFDQAAFSGSYTVDGATAPLDGAAVDAASGAVTLPLPDDVGASELLVTASLDPLVTSPHAVQLAPVTTQQRIRTVLPGQFPSAAGSLRLTDLEGADGLATGELTITGPTEGGDGTVCLTGEPAITSDNADRAGTFAWTVTAADGTALSADDCVTVPQGGSAVLSVTAANPTPADADVSATLPLSVASGAGDAVPQDVPVGFRSTFPVNVGAVAGLTLALILLGVLIPLVALWVLNLVTTRIAMRGSFQRAVVPVRISESGVTVEEAPDRVAERFRNIREAEARSLEDAELGGLKAVVPLWPLRAPTFRVGPPPGRVVLAGRTGSGSARTGDRRADGSLRFASLPLDAFWAITATESAIDASRPGEPVAGTAVLYHRYVTTEDAGQYATRIADLERDAAPTAHETITALRARRAERRAAAARTPRGGDGAGTTGAGGSAPRSDTRPTPPPAPGAAPAPGATGSGPSAPP